MLNGFALNITKRNTVMKIVKKIGQQGDLLLRKLESIPNGEAKIISRKRCVLANGEHTGHQHMVEESEAELIQIGERILLKLSKIGTVVHPEHKPITLSPGIWEIGRVKEFDWFSKMERQVID